MRPSMMRLISIVSCAFLVVEATAAEFDVTTFHAVGDATTMNTAAIQSTIDAAAAAGGGTVVVPEGVFRSGSIFLKQGVSLHLSRGAVLLGSNNIEDYPKRPTRIEGHVEPWRLALVNATGNSGVRISGEGTLDGNGILFWAAFWQRRKENPNCTNLEVERPRMIHLADCRDVRIEGVALRDSGFWNIHLYRCQDVLVEGVSIFTPGPGSSVRAPSTDGIDIDSCQRVTVRRCRIEVDDDCIALKGSKGPLADKDESSPPVETILVEDCEFPRGHGVVTFGSEATIVRDVIVRRCTVTGQNNLVRLKLRPDTPQLYENILFEDITLSGGAGRIFRVDPWMQFFDPQGHEPPPSIVRHLTLRRVRGNYGTLGIFKGSAHDSLSDVVLEDIELTLADTAFDVGDVRDVTSSRVVVNGAPWVFPRSAGK